MMYNPPWVLALAYPFALLDWPAARLAGLIVQTVVVLVSAERLGRMLGGGGARDGEAGVFAALTFFPVWTALRMGQFSVFQLAAVAGLTGLTPASGVWTGALLALLLVKPQLTAVSGMILALWCVRVRAWRVAGGMLLALLVSAVIVTLSNPSVWQQYPGRDGESPSGSFHFSDNRSASCADGWHRPASGFSSCRPRSGRCGDSGWTRHRNNWNWRTAGILPLFVGCLTAGYGGWMFDLIVLLPAVILVGLDFRNQRLQRERACVSCSWLLTRSHNSSCCLTQNVTQQWAFVWSSRFCLALTLLLVPAAGELATSPRVFDCRWASAVECTYSSDRLSRSCQ